jgi:hypothetical protein
VYTTFLRAILASIAINIFDVLEIWIWTIWALAKALNISIGFLVDRNAEMILNRRTSNTLSMSPGSRAVANKNR